MNIILNGQVLKNIALKLETRRAKGKHQFYLTCPGLPSPCSKDEKKKKIKRDKLLRITKKKIVMSLFTDDMLVLLEYSKEFLESLQVC